VDDQIRDLLGKVGLQLHTVSLEDPPPAMAAKLQQIVNRELGTDDPLKEIKRQSNEAAMAWYESAMNMIEQSHDPLLTALQTAIAGNIIDYGAIHDIQVEEELRQIMDQERSLLQHESSELFAYDQFKKDISKARSVLYLGDNAGELIFDKALIVTLQRLYPLLDITFATRGRPIFNDILLEDASWVGLDKLVTVVSSGSGTPGLILEESSKEFRELFSSSDLIISKGQGNLEGLFDVPGPIYFLFVAKCKPIAALLGCKVRDILLRRQNITGNPS
jgi:uncharacterized protein with ATP-grasp and redox domains